MLIFKGDTKLNNILREIEHYSNDENIVKQFNVIIYHLDRIIRKGEGYEELIKKYYGD